MNPCVINSKQYWLRYLVSFQWHKLTHLVCHLVWLNILIMLLHFLSMSQSFLYTNLISLVKVITRFVLLCQLSTKLLFIKQFRFSPHSQMFFHHFKLNWFLLWSLLSLIVVLNAISLRKIIVSARKYKNFPKIIPFRKYFSQWN